MMDDIKIRKVDGGYIVRDRYGTERIIVSTQELFEYLLLVFEGRADTFSGYEFGQVIINRKELE